MWGALIFLMFFLAIAPSTRDVILAMLEQARLRVAVEAPLSYFLLVILGGSALVSFLIMRFWPRAQESRAPVCVVRRYQGQAAADLSRAQQQQAFGLPQMVEFLCLALPVRARLVCLKLLGVSPAVSGFNRLPGA
jgi:hypothetical protein